MEALRIVREEEPPAPSRRLESAPAAADVAAVRQTTPGRLVRLVRGELDWVVMRGLEKDRARRYESVAALAEDVRRFLADEPVAAGPPSRWYRVRKFVRRNKRGLAMAAVLGLALLVGVGAVAASVAWTIRDTAARRAKHAEDGRQGMIHELDWAERLLADGKRVEA